MRAFVWEQYNALRAQASGNKKKHTTKSAVFYLDLHNPNQSILGRGREGGVEWSSELFFIE